MSELEQPTNAQIAALSEEKKEADARLLREGADNQSSDELAQSDIFQRLLVALIEYFQGNTNAFNGIMDTVQQTLQDAAKEQAAQPESADADNSSKNETEQEEPETETPSYVNEGQGPLLTVINKDPDPQVSPLIDIALKQNEPGSNILTDIWKSNAGHEIGQENTVQVPFAPEPVQAEVAASVPAVEQVQPASSTPPKLAMG